jgi:hypothetical protein
VGQTTTGDIFGTVLDATGAVVPGAQMSVLNLLTNLKHEATTTESGAFRVPLLPAGRYQVTVEKAGFARQVRGPINLALNQQAELNFTLQVSSASETISVVADAAILNTTNAEISTRFDTKRIADLPLSTNRNIMNLAASVPGVAQLSSGNTGYGSSGNQGTESGSLAYSANGMRLRSNGFLIDGQDSYYPGTGGLWQSINNPDIIAEVRMVTNQFLPEYGRTGGSVMSIITKSGTNELHGSAFWFHNDNHLNALSNTDKLIQPTPTRALYRVENQFGGSGGGPVIKNRTFVFGSLLRWTDRRLGSGTSIFGAPSEEGRRLLQDIAGSRPTVQALLENLPAGTPNGQSRPVTVGERTVNIPLSTLTGSGAQKFNDWQYSLKADHRLSEKHGLMGRYMDDSSTVTGTGQLTPTGLANVAPAKQRSATVQLASTFSPATFNEFRAAYQRWDTSTNAENPSVAERIPSIEVPELGLRGFNAATTRTGIGLGANLPQYTIMNNYQVQDSFSILRGGHSMKFGFDFRRQEQNQLFLPQIRGRLEYATLQRLVDDRATVAQINAPLTGGETITHLKYYEYFFFLQDEWRMNRRFTLTYGVRYESPGDWMKNLVELNNRIVAANNNDERYRLYPVPPRDTNNWAPRVGFNYRPPRGPGFLGVLTGDEKLVMRGGFSRTFDVAFTNIALNIFSSFPLVLAYNVPADSTATIPNALNTINSIRSGNVPAIPNPNILVRTIVSKDFRAPLAEQVSFQIQRELTSNYALTAGYVGTKGTALFQTVDGNPTAPTAGIPRTVRSDPTRGVIRERCNCTSSTYHSLQMSLEKRLSQNFTMAAHYTWSSFIDGASEIFNPSTSGEIAFPQDPYDRRSERARSTYDRPHRFTVNGVWELPWRRGRRDLAGYILSGWQLNGFLTLQSGAPFGALNGSDPGGVVLGNIVGTSIRPNLNTKLDLSHMDVRGIQAAGGAALFRGVSVANPIGNAGRNIMRANGINRLDFGIIKNTRILEGHTLQLHVNFFNATNSRDWGIPEGSITSAAFLNEGAAEVPARKIQVGLRYSF